MDLATLTSIVGIPSIVGVVVWSIRQEGRLNSHDQMFVQREKLADERHNDLKERLRSIDDTLKDLPRRLNGRVHD